MFPANETGELIRRTLANKSWFDTISSTWVHLFWKQFLAVAGVTLVAGLVGFSGASVLFYVLHYFSPLHVMCCLLLHENHRTKSAKTSVAEQLELQKNLEQGKSFGRGCTGYKSCGRRFGRGHPPSKYRRMR